MEDKQIIVLYWQRSDLAISANKMKEPGVPEPAFPCGTAGSDFISCAILRIVQLTTVVWRAILKLLELQL